MENSESEAIQLLKLKGYQFDKKLVNGPEVIFIHRRRYSNGTKYQYCLHVNKQRGVWWEEFVMLKLKDLNFEPLTKEE